MHEIGQRSVPTSETDTEVLVHLVDDVLSIDRDDSSGTNAPEPPTIWVPYFIACSE